MASTPLSVPVKEKLKIVSRRLGTVSPLDYVGGLIDRSFTMPADDAEKYAVNTLTPGAVPLEPSFAEGEPDVFRFTIEPLGPTVSPVSRRDESTREMRRLVNANFGREALRWFDQQSEEWRSMNTVGRLAYGAWFGSAYDRDGLSAAKVYYELYPGQLDALPPALQRLVHSAMASLPTLVPLFTSIGCGRDVGSQRVTFVHLGPLRLMDLQPLLSGLGMAHQLPSMMQIVGLALGGRFDLPPQSVMIGLQLTPDGPEMKFEVMLGVLPDVPRRFIDLLKLGLSERPRQLRALNEWLEALTPEGEEAPGDFSVMSIRITPRTAARVSLYLRPVEFEFRDQTRR